MAIVKPFTRGPRAAGRKHQRLPPLRLGQSILSSRRSKPSDQNGAEQSTRAKGWREVDAYLSSLPLRTLSTWWLLLCERYSLFALHCFMPYKLNTFTNSCDWYANTVCECCAKGQSSKPSRLPPRSLHKKSNWTFRSWNNRSLVMINIIIHIGALLLLLGATCAADHALRGIVSSWQLIFPFEWPKLNLGLLEASTIDSCWLEAIVFRYD